MTASFNDFINGKAPASSAASSGKTPSFAEFVKTVPSIAPKPTLGQKVGGFVKDVAKDAFNTLLVKPAVRTTEAVTHIVAPNSMAEKGFQMQRDAGNGQDVNLGPLGKYNVPTVKPFGQGGGKQVLGDALQSASWLAGGGVARDAAGNVIKQTFRQALPKLAVEGALIGGSGAAGQELSNNPDATLASTLKAGGKGAAIGAVVGPAAGGLSRALGSLFTKAASKTATEAGTKIASEAAPIIDKTISETAPKVAEKVVPTVEELQKGLVDTTGLHDIRTVMTGLEQAYSKKDVTKIMEELNQMKPNMTRYSPSDVAEVAVKYKPTVELPGYVSPNVKPPKINATLPKVEAPKISGAPEIPVEKAPSATKIREITRPGIGMPRSVKGDTVAKAASDVNQGIVDKGFNALAPEEQARYNSVQRKFQVQDIANLMEHNILLTRDMALGKERIPAHVDPQILFNAMEAHAQAHGDIQYLRELAKSPLATQRSLLAQKLGAAAVGKSQNSIVDLINEVTQARSKPEELIKATKDIENVIKKNEVKVSRPSLEQFIKDIEC